MGTYDGIYSFNQFDNKITKVGGYGDWTKPRWDTILSILSVSTVWVRSGLVLMPEAYPD